MNGSEFNTWLKHYQEQFPATQKWIQNLPGDGTSLLRQWMVVLQNVTLEEAMDITNAMAQGRVERVGPYDSDREQTAYTIKRAVMEKRTRNQPREYEKTPRRGTYRAPAVLENMRDQVAKYVELTKGGMSTKDALDEVCPYDPSLPEPRYRCPDCLDTGLVEVWSWDSMLAYRVDKDSLRDDPTKRRIMTVPCGCFSGEKYVLEESAQPARFKGWSKHAVRYTSERYCIARYGDTRSEESVDAFFDWCNRRWPDFNEALAELDGDWEVIE